MKPGLSSRTGHLRKLALLLGAAVVVVGAWAWTAPAPARAPRLQAEPITHTIAGLAFTAPAEAEVTEQTGFPEGVRVVAVTRGDEVLLLTAYAGDSALKPDKALATHTEQIERQVGKDGASIAVDTVWIRLLGRSRRANKVTYGPEAARHVARIVAARKSKVTVVAAWTTPAAVKKDAFSPGLVKALTLAR